jgi:hypothetical protein
MRLLTLRIRTNLEIHPSNQPIPHCPHLLGQLLRPTNMLITKQALLIKQHIKRLSTIHTRHSTTAVAGFFHNRSSRELAFRALSEEGIADSRFHFADAAEVFLFISSQPLGRLGLPILRLFAVVMPTIHPLPLLRLRLQHPLLPFPKKLSIKLRQVCRIQFDRSPGYGVIIEIFNGEIGQIRPGEGQRAVQVTTSGLPEEEALTMTTEE